MPPSRRVATGRLSRADLEAVLNLVRLAYEGLSQREAWLEMLRHVRTLFAARDAWLIRIPLEPASTPLLLAPDVDPGILRAYSGKDRGCFTNPAMKRVLEEEIDGVINSTDIVPWQEIEKTDYYDAIRRPRGVRWEVGAASFNDSDSLRFMTVNRAKTAPRFDGREHAILELLLPHIVEVLRIDDQRASAEAREAVLRAAVDQLDGAAFFLRTTGVLRALNENAEKLLKSERLPGKVTLAGGPRDSSLLAFLRESLGFLETVGSPEKPSPVKTASRVVSLARGRRARLQSDLRFENGTIAGMLISVRLEGAGSPASDVDLASWEFTDREMEVARTLLKGSRGEEICRILGISRETLKTHLRHLCEKTETRGRTQLVTRLFQGPGAGEPPG